MCSDLSFCFYFSLVLSFSLSMRNLTSATQIYKDHVAAIMSVNYSPTGQELVSGSYDRTIRLWNVGQGSHSRDVYHTKRMQRLFCVSHTLDSRFIVSGSDDGNVRLWKSKASEALGIRSGKDRAHREYSEALRNKWRASGEISKIERQRHVPKAIKGAQKLKRTMLEAERVKEDRRRKHTKVSFGEERSARARVVFDSCLLCSLFAGPLRSSLCEISSDLYFIFNPLLLNLSVHRKERSNHLQQERTQFSRTRSDGSTRFISFFSGFYCVLHINFL